MYHQKSSVMKKLMAQIPKYASHKNSPAVLGTFVLMLYLFICSPSAVSESSNRPSFVTARDSAISAEIQTYLNYRKDKSPIYYPLSVKKFYSKNHFQPVWIKSEKEIKKTWEAMLILDCVLQYGLSHDDYHPKELIYDKLHRIIDQPVKISNNQKAVFDVLLTDAMITLLNHLHYGKLNAAYPASVIDEGSAMTFRAEDVLKNALENNDFMSFITSVQPTTKQYSELQSYMRLLKGQYLDDCYEVPEADVRKIAINMERLRWTNINGDNYIQVNIPSYTLTYQHQDSVYQFKVVVGKSMSPTPVLQSVVTYFKTAPDWNVPAKIFIKGILPKALKDPNYLENNHYAIYDLKGNYIQADAAHLIAVKKNPENYFLRQSAGCDNSLGLIAFRFPNNYDVYLHDTPEKQLFSRSNRALSHGCIRIEDAEKLASLLLKYDQAEDKLQALHSAIINYKPQQFYLKNPVLLNITYLTCEMKNGMLVKYQDIYNRDQELEAALYNLTKKPAALKKPQSYNQ